MAVENKGVSVKLFLPNTVTVEAVVMHKVSCCHRTQQLEYYSNNKNVPFQTIQRYALNQFQFSLPYICSFVVVHFDPPL